MSQTQKDDCSSVKEFQDNEIDSLSLRENSQNFRGNPDKKADCFVAKNVNAPRNANAFTLAETLITLVIIGIVAPMLKNSTDGKEWNVARQKARASIGEGFRLMSLNEEATPNLTTQQFVEKIVPKYIKIAKSCSTAKDCGFPTKIKRPDGTSVNLLTTMKTITSPYSVTVPAVPNSGADGTFDTTNPTTDNYDNAYFFTTLDGFRVMFFYNPYCVSNAKDKPFRLDTTNYSYTNIYPQMSLDTACYYGTYDMNGTKGPNQVGKDIGFVGAIYNGVQTQAAAVLPHSEEVAANADLKSKMGISGDDYWQAAYQYCQKLDKDNWDLPDVNDLTLIYLNKKLVTDSTNWFWSRSAVAGSSTMRRVHFDNGRRGWNGRSDSGTYVRCVRRTAMR